MIAQAQTVEEGGAQAERQLRSGHDQMRDPFAAQNQVQLSEHEGAEALLDDAVFAFDGLQARYDADSRGAGHHHGACFQGLLA